MSKRCNDCQFAIRCPRCKGSLKLEKEMTPAGAIAVLVCSNCGERSGMVKDERKSLNPKPASEVGDVESPHQEEEFDELAPGALAHLLQTKPKRSVESVIAEIRAEQRGRLGTASAPTPAPATPNATAPPQEVIRKVVRIEKIVEKPIYVQTIITDSGITINFSGDDAEVIKQFAEEAGSGDNLPSDLATAIYMYMQPKRGMKGKQRR